MTKSNHLTYRKKKIEENKTEKTTREKEKKTTTRKINEILGKQRIKTRHKLNRKFKIMAALACVEPNAASLDAMNGQQQPQPQQQQQQQQHHPRQQQQQQHLLISAAAATAVTSSDAAATDNDVEGAEQEVHHRAEIGGIDTNFRAKTTMATTMATTTTTTTTSAMTMSIEELANGATDPQELDDDGVR